MNIHAPLFIDRCQLIAAFFYFAFNTLVRMRHCLEAFLINEIAAFRTEPVGTMLDTLQGIV